MVRDKVAQLPSYLVRQWRLATKHKTNSLWLRRGRTQPSPVLLQEKSIQTDIPLSAFCPFFAISNISFKVIPKLSWHMQPLGKSQNIPFTSYHHPLSMLVFRQAFVRQFIWRRVISKYCFTFQLLRDKKGKKNYLWHIWKVVYSGSPWVKWVESTVLVPVSFTSGLCWFQANFKLIVFLFTSPVPFRKLSLRHLAYTCLAKGKCDCKKIW